MCSPRECPARQSLGRPPRAPGPVSRQLGHAHTHHPGSLPGRRQCTAGTPPPGTLGVSSWLRLRGHCALWAPSLACILECDERALETGS
eukprot:15459016-Alexandrium_andersonii.AAC.1